MKNRGAAGGQNEIVEDERALARDGREETASFQMTRAQRKEGEGSANEDDKNCEDEDPPHRVARKSVHGSQNA
jgi:hypothetical protein